MDIVQSLITNLQLEPHPEGGFFRETYRSKEIIDKETLPSYFKGNRNYCTSIYYLLRSEDFSAFHKINQDEIWHFYMGSPIELYSISLDGTLKVVKIGLEITNSEVPQYVVPKHNWFAAKVVKPESFSLVGCTVSPGFDFNDFILAKKDDLISKFPQHETLITNFTRQ